MKCLICGNNSQLICENIVGYRKSLDYKIYHCSYCNTDYSMPRTEDVAEIYDAIYRNSDKLDGYTRYRKYAKEIKYAKDPMDYLIENEDVYWGVYDVIKRIDDDYHKLKILEVGSGLGYLTFSLRKAGYIIDGIDYSKEAVRSAIKEFGEYYIADDVYRNHEKYQGKYNVVILTEVIEHINDPIAFLMALKKIVSKNGYIILTTPNKEFYPSEMQWATDLPPVHSWWFSKKSINEIAKIIETNVEFVDFKEYYKKHYKSVDIRQYKNGCKNRVPMLSENFNMNKKRVVVANKYNSKKSTILRFVKKIRDVMSKNRIICKEDGNVICAYLKC